MLLEYYMVWAAMFLHQIHASTIEKNPHFFMQPFFFLFFLYSIICMSGSPTFICATCSFGEKFST